MKNITAYLKLVDLHKKLMGVSNTLIAIHNGVNLVRNDPNLIIMECITEMNNILINAFQESYEKEVYQMVKITILHPKKDLEKLKYTLNSYDIKFFEDEE